MGCGSARCGTAWHGKARINKQTIRVRHGMAWFDAVMQGKARLINNEYRIRLGSAWRGSVGFGKARFNK